MNCKETDDDAVILLETHILRRTDRAICVSETGLGDDAVWLPLSLVEAVPVAGKPYFAVSMPEGLAQREGLI